MKLPILALGIGMALEALAVVLKWFGWIPTWSTVIFLGFFLFGFYKTWQAFVRSEKVSFNAVWGFFFLTTSFAFLGQEFGIWHFWTVKNSIVLIAFFFSLGLFASTFFLKNLFARILMMVPAIFLIVLATLAFLTFYHFLQQEWFIPLWQINIGVVVLTLLWIAGQAFVKRKDLSKPLRLS